MKRSQNSGSQKLKKVYSLFDEFILSYSDMAMHIPTVFAAALPADGGNAVLWGREAPDLFQPGLELFQERCAKGLGCPSVRWQLICRPSFENPQDLRFKGF
jgi:hypothetical protein